MMYNVLSFLAGVAFLAIILQVPRFRAHWQRLIKVGSDGTADHQWILLCLVCVTAGMFLGFTLCNRFGCDFQFQKLHLEWLTALGTLGAVIVALLFGVYGVLEKQGEGRAKSQLAAAQVAHDLEVFKAEAQHWKKQLALALFTTMRNVPQAAVVENKLMKASREELLVFSEVHPRVGVYVAEAIALLRLVEAWRQTTYTRPAKGEEPLEQIRSRWAAENVLDAHAKLSSAVQIVRHVLNTVPRAPWVFGDEN